MTMDGFTCRVQTYTGQQLDILGQGSDVPRLPGETDAEYRPRILAAVEEGLRDNLAWRAERAKEGAESVGALGLPETPPEAPADTPEAPQTLQQMMDARLQESALDRIDRMFRDKGRRKL